MRTFVLLCLLLPACASHDVRCDRKLLQINPPGARVNAPAQAGAGVGAP